MPTFFIPPHKNVIVCLDVGRRERSLGTQEHNCSDQLVRTHAHVEGAEVRQFIAIPSEKSNPNAIPIAFNHFPFQPHDSPLFPRENHHFAFVNGMKG
jgi:hypothetical protein